jgi:hypothetical protein
MEKVCVFCGKPPLNKSKEHIIPQWLLKLTGNENRTVSLGSNWATGKEIIFNFSSFTFPACERCNNAFAEIEGKVKLIMIKILNDEAITTKEILLLLDWFDKVRISLWLGIQYLNRGVLQFDPKYYINARVGLKDRFLSITNTYSKKQALRWTGANTMCFLMGPTVITLQVNNIIFVNGSSDFIVSEKLGFPYPLFVRPNPQSPATDFYIVPGKEKSEPTLFQSQLYQPHIIISQPIFSVSKGQFDQHYNSSFVREHSYDFEKGQGKLFITEKGNTYVMEEDEEISFEDENKSIKLQKFNRPTLELQIEVLQQPRFNLELLSPEQKRQHHESLKAIIDYTKEQMRQFDY